MAWAQQTAVSSTVVTEAGTWNEDTQQTEWAPPQPVHRGGADATAPQVVLDSNGEAHLVWRAGIDVLYSRCDAGSCTQPLTLSGGAEPACDGVAVAENSGRQQPPALAISPDDDLMIIWHGADGALRYARGPISASAPATEIGCVLADGLESPTQL